MIRTLSILVFVITLASAQSFKTLWNDAHPGFLSRGVVLDIESFNETRILEICKSILEEDADRRFVQVRFFSSERSAHPMPKLDHMTFSS